jgi:hypothetical protein
MGENNSWLSIESDIGLDKEGSTRPAGGHFASEQSSSCHLKLGLEVEIDYIEAMYILFRAQSTGTNYAKSLSNAQT